MRRITVPCPDMKNCKVNHFETVYDRRDMNREYKRGFADAIGTVLDVLNDMKSDISPNNIVNLTELLAALKKDVQSK